MDRCICPKCGSDCEYDENKQSFSCRKTQKIKDKHKNLQLLNTNSANLFIVAHGFLIGI